MDLLVLDPTQDPDQDGHITQATHVHEATHYPVCFRKEVDDDGICLLTFDTPNASANVWNFATLEELDRHIEDLHRDPEIRALVICSAKERVFIAGADLKMVQKLPPVELHELLALGQDVFTHLESLRIPKIAAIHGACVGGGFEMTLACDYRIASRSECTRIGLPETQLGLIPGWGGSTRLPRLIGLPKALDLIVRGKTMVGAQAKRLGLVHETVPVEHLLAFAKKMALQPMRIKPHHFHLTQLWPIPQVLRYRAKSLLVNKYPWMKDVAAAPLVAVDVITRGAAKSFETSLFLEQQAIRKLAHSGMTKSLIGTFLLKESASKKLPARFNEVEAPRITRVAVIGAGVMGSGIAYALACKGTRVLLCDTSPEFIARGVGRINQLFRSGVQSHVLSRKQAQESKDRISFTSEPVPMKRMDLVIEAVVEEMTVKKQLLADLAKRCREDTIIATNTSALSVAEMAKAVPHPERVIGLHFFNPAHLMPLVEVVHLENTKTEAVAAAMRFVQSIGKTPILVKDAPGFIVNRILVPYLLGAVQLAVNMRDPWILDDAMVEFGMPMGPLRLLDEVGFDVALHVEKTLRTAFGDQVPACSLLHDMHEHGMLGRKNERGFYTAFHDKTGPQANPEVLPFLQPKSKTATRTEIVEQLHRLMQTEAQRCLDDGVADNHRDIELAMTLGAGYPPFRPLFPHQS
ncbi:fatty acid oxidation complex subunit alpha FadB [soil metagenome]